MKSFWFLTCEHASSSVPRKYRALFANREDLLRSHQGCDIGAKHYAQAIADQLSWPLFCGSVTRLLIDLNRSLHHPHLFSAMTAPLDRAAQQDIIARYYHPLRSAVRHVVEEKVAAGMCVVHISCHSFTPLLGKERRTMDVGILYDPCRRDEKMIGQRLRHELASQTSMRIRLNAPYRGVSDGHVKSLRKIFASDCYLGLELEVNQAMYLPSKALLWQHAWLPRLIDVLRCLAGRRS